jgi:3-oxoacyl-[acyl-carrier protein] reductase
MDLNLKSKRALVAGSSSGIGLACAELFVAEGAEVCLVARSEERLEAEAERLMKSSGRAVHCVASDLSTPDGVEHAWTRASALLGGVDILVNNAGGPKSGPFSSLSDADWEHAFRLNLMSTVRLTRLVLSGMKGSKWGRIVNITSTSVKQPIEGLMLSNSLRMAVVGFAKTLADEVGEYGITINTVGPGYTATERLDQLAAAKADREGVSAADVVERWKRDVPLGRIGRPEEIAAVVAFLCSEAAGYVNGVVLAVDGGRVRSAL